MEYTPPPQSTEAGKVAPSAVDHAADTSEPTPELVAAESVAADESKSAAGEFGDDLAKTLSAEEPTPTPSESAEPTDTTPITDSTPPPASVVGDRYATKTTDAAPPAAPAESTTASATPAATDDFEALFKEPVDSNDPPDSPVNSSMPTEQREAIAEESDKPIPNVDDDDFLNAARRAELEHAPRCVAVGQQAQPRGAGERARCTRGRRRKAIQSVANAGQDGWASR